MGKPALRAAQIARRDALAPAGRASAQAAIVQRLRSLPAWQRARCVLSYMAFGSELDLAALHQDLLQAGRRLVLPRVPESGRLLELREVRDLAHDLAPGRWGIPEPRPERCPLVPDHDVELVVVPGVSFDRTGNRLGYGAGFYDRLFERLPRAALRVACAFEAMVLEQVPSEAHDQPVDLLVTETMAWVCQRPVPVPVPTQSG